MDAVGKVLAKEPIKADVFIDKLITCYLLVINSEQDYFLKQFPELDDFKAKFVFFRAEFEYELLSKRMRP